MARKTENAVRIQTAEIKPTEDILLSVLEQRQIESYRDKVLCEELGLYFESEGDEVVIPMISRGGKRKQRVLSADAVGGSLGGDHGGGPQTHGGDLDRPSTNRAVTFHGPPTGGQNPDPAEDMQLGGYDGGVEVGFQGNWVDWKWVDVQETLEAARLAATEAEKPVEFELCGRLFLMHVTGARRGVMYKYYFEGDGVTFLIHSNPQGKIQPVRLRYNAEGLIGRDLFIKHGEVLEILEEFGFFVHKEIVSRADLQVMRVAIEKCSAWKKGSGK